MTHREQDPLPGSHIEMRHYSAALTEIYQLRAALAQEAELRRLDLLLKTYPVGRRRLAEAAIARMNAAAQGAVSHVYPAPGMNNKTALAQAGADECLTRYDWETHVDQLEDQSL